MMTMGTSSLSLMRRISSRRPDSSTNEEGDVMLNTRRKPWPFFIYTSRIEARQMSVRVSHFGQEWQDGFFSLNCSVPAVSRLLFVHRLDTCGSTSKRDKFKVVVQHRVA